MNQNNTKPKSYRCPPNERKSPKMLQYGVAGAVGLFLIKLSVSRLSAKSLSDKRPGFFRNFYEGGFKPQMDRAEAALILGCRRSSPPQTVLKKYRAMININHPDRGGSPYIARKVNEAKSILINKK